MSGDLDLEQRYRRVPRLLPGYYRDKWEQDMVAAFLDSWLTGDPEEDQAILKFCRPTWPEVASVAAWLQTKRGRTSGQTDHTGVGADRAVVSGMSRTADLFVPKPSPREDYQPR